MVCELDKLKVDAEVLYRTFETLSLGERTKVMLTVLFSGENEFLLIDEPLNYIDVFSRMQIEKLLLSYQPTMILVEHDKTFAQKVRTKIVEF